ncbi:MAG TPA: ribosome maturation factor RimM [Aggregatilineaceae bacterium]|nr:ribosome maturation factor RimM [Aggregatilineaceae bacterium]
MDNQPPFLLLGRVLRPHGVRGEVRMSVLTDFPDRIQPGARIYIGSDPESAAGATPYELAHVRRHQEYLILSFEGIEDRDDADLLRDQYVMVALADAVPLEEDEFYLFQTIGLSVRTTEGEVLGKVTEVLETGANDVYVVQGPRGEILLPDTEECVIDVDIKARTMTVKLLDGLLGD